LKPVRLTRGIRSGRLRILESSPATLWPVPDGSLSALPHSFDVYAFSNKLKATGGEYKP